MPAQFNLQGIAIPPNNRLSPLDKAYAFLNYPYLNAAPSYDHNVNLNNALNAAGVSGDSRISIEREYSENDWEGVRTELTRWTLNQIAASLAAADEVEA